MNGIPGFVHPRLLIDSYGGEARKRFGQHFLCSPGVVSGILRVSRVGEGSRVVEVGPGLGVMTGPLLARCGEVVAVELDRDLADFLEERHPQLRLIRGDATKVDWGETLDGPGWVVVANLPYNVGNRIITGMLSRPETFDRCVVMVQREVANRLVAPAGDRKRGSLSVYVEARAEARLALQVPPGAFHPPPKVDSAVVELKLRRAPETEDIDLGDLETVVRAGFQQPRKMIRRTLGASFGKARALALLEQAGVDQTARPGTLDLAQWAALTRAFRGGASLPTDDVTG